MSTPSRRAFLSCTLSALLTTTAFAAPASGKSRLVSASLSSSRFDSNKIVVSRDRKLQVYLPPEYDKSRKRYPVIYYLPNMLEGYDALFRTNSAQSLFDISLATGVIRDFILVTGDYDTPVASSFYTNSPVTGNWEDFIVEDLVSYMDQTYRTLPAARSRGLLGDRMGGYGAIRIAMRRPGIFGCVYAQHPVGTGNGVQKMQERPDWNVMWSAKSLEDIKGNIFNRIFTAIYQAHLPNPENAPLFVDLPVRLENGNQIYDDVLIARLQNSFFLERMLPAHASSLKKLNAFKFDWGRNDTNYDHVYSNQAFANKLEEYRIPFEAEEFHGWWGERHWGQDGRIMTDVLPFFNRHLAFSQ
jgi:S-formylglutathione hydrolase FrmB